MFTNLRKRWIIANFAGLAIGGLLHPLIAHGLTGGHEFWLTLPQFLMHTTGYFTIGVWLAFAQRWALKPIVPGSRLGMLSKALLFVAAEWAVYYSVGIPFNTVAGFLVLGIASGLEMRGAIPGWKRWTAVSAAGFAAASVPGILVVAAAQNTFPTAFADELLGPVLIWIIIGSVGGLAAGLLTARSLAKSLGADSDVSPGSLAKTSLSFVLLLGLLCGAIMPATAQTRQGLGRTRGSNPTNACKGGWTGSITFAKTLNYSFAEKKKNIVKGTTEHTKVRSYQYSGRVQVRDWHELVVGIAAQLDNKTPLGQVSFKDEDKNFRRTVGQDTCGSNSGLRDQWINSVDNTSTNASAEGEMKAFNLSVLKFNGTYNFSFQFPEARGTLDREMSHTSGGFCNPKNNGTQSNPRKSEVIIKGDGATIQNQKLDPKNPDVLAGSVTRDTSVNKDGKSFIYTVSWNLRRCPAPLELEAIELDDKPGPGADSWKRIHTFTEDGNLVRIRARVTNYSNETRFPVLTFSEAESGFDLPGGRINASIGAGESREVTLVWDTQGASRIAQRTIKVELEESTSPRREMSVPLKVSLRGILPTTDGPEVK
jgi:hypothetical protein